MNCLKGLVPQTIHDLLQPSPIRNPYGRLIGLYFSHDESDERDDFIVFLLTLG